MFEVALMVDVILAEREREIEAALRRRRLLEPRDDATESVPAPIHATHPPRPLAARTRPTGG